MKVLKTLRLLLMLLCVGSLVACSSDEEGNADNPNILTEFTPSQASTIYFSNGIDFGANAGEQEITFTSNKSWSVSSTVGWCRAVSDRGSAGDASFRIVVDENPSYESREGVLTLKVGELNNYITVRQGGVGSARIHVEEAGTLPALLGDDYEQITDLTLTGELNGTDFKFLRDNSFWNRLQKLNLTDARIVAGGERYYTGMPNYLQSDTLSYCLLWGYQFVELQLPSTIKAIGMQSLGGCSNLKSIVIPESVTSIGDHAFSACYDLESVNIPQHLVEIGAGAFSQCTSLKQLQLPQSLSYISNSLFSGCSNLQSIEIPLSVDSVAAGAFYGCKSLTKLVIPESVQYIEGGIQDSGLNYYPIRIDVLSTLVQDPNIKDQEDISQFTLVDRELLEQQLITQADLNLNEQTLEQEIKKIYAESIQEGEEYLDAAYEEAADYYNQVKAAEALGETVNAGGGSSSSSNDEISMAMP